MMLRSLYDLTGPSHEHALRVLYTLLAERPFEHGISHKAMPSWEEHCAFAADRPFRFWYLIEVDGEYIGCIEVLPTNEFGIHILIQYQGRGYGKAAVRLFLSTHDPLPAIPALRNGHWLANVAPANTRAAEFFRQLGGTVIQQTFDMGSGA